MSDEQLASMTIEQFKAFLKDGSLPTAAAIRSTVATSDGNRRILNSQHTN